MDCYYGPAVPLDYSSAGFGPSNCLLRASSASELFECGLRSLKILSSGQQHLRIIQVRASVPRNSLFRPAALPDYLSAGSGPSNCLLRASSTSELFECGLRSLEILSSGQQRFRIIRVRALVHRIVFFGPAAPPNYSSAGSGPSKFSLWASSTSGLFECGFWSLELSSSGQQRLRIIRVRALVPRIVFFGPSAPQLYSSLGFRSLELHLSAISAFILFGCRSLSPESLFRAVNALHSKYPNPGGNIPVRMPYVKYEGKSTVCNTRWPGICIKHALPRNFPYLRYEVCTDGRIGCLTMNWALTW
jgi:hypothetical protein